LTTSVANDGSSQYDWDKVATVANFKTPKYARDQWAIVKKKLGGASTASAAATPTSSKATPSRKRKKLEGNQYGALNAVTATALTSLADVEAGDEEPAPTDQDDETPSKKSKPPKTPNTPKWKKTQAKETMKKVKAEVEGSDAEAEVEAEVEKNDNTQARRETPGLQAQVDEQIKTEMHEDLDDQFADADMFRMD
jgi:hypothetical protein